MIRPSHYTTPRQLKDATLTGIGFDAPSTPSPVFVFIGFLIGFILGVLL